MADTFIHGCEFKIVLFFLSIDFLRKFNGANFYNVQAFPPVASATEMHPFCIPGTGS